MIINKLPDKYSKRWLVIFLSLFVSILAILLLSGKIFYPDNVNYDFYRGMFMISIIFSLACYIVGYIGAKYIFLSSVAGVFLGLILLIINYTQKTGWEDLTGMASFIMVSVAGILLGVFIESFMYLKGKLNKRDKN